MYSYRSSALGVDRQSPGSSLGMYCPAIVLADRIQVLSYQIKAYLRLNPWTGPCIVQRKDLVADDVIAWSKEVRTQLEPTQPRLVPRRTLIDVQVTRGCVL